MNEPRIFLCHASEDKPRVRELYHRLKEAGYHPWLDKEDLLPGQDWRHEIEKIVRDPYNIVVVCLSCNSVTKRGVVQQEIKWALDVLDQTPDGTIYLIPARLEECQVPDRLSKLHWVNLFEAGGFEKLKQALDFEIRRRLEPELVLIPAGEFLMGSDPRQDEDAQPNEQPQHRLFLPDYYMAKAPVTNAQYLAFVQAAPYDVPEHWKGGKPLAGQENHPIVNVSWRNAVAYCDWLSKAAGKPYRLPSEAEWEKGARGGLFLDGDIAAQISNPSPGRIYPWGDEWDAQRCNTSEGGKGGTTPVGSYRQGASPYNLLDMAGNVLEWTSSLRGRWAGQDKEMELQFGYPYDPKDGREDLESKDSMMFRGLRGGSWASKRSDARCAFRYELFAVAHHMIIGFRVVASPISPPFAR